MARGADEDAVCIKYVFPRDYELLERMLTVKQDGIELNDEYIKKSFEVHPECDLPSKMRSMLFSKKYGYINFSSLRNKNGDERHYEPNDDTYSHKGDTTWKEYLFETPNIRQILGMRRDFAVHNLKDVFQNPFLFLLHLYLEVGMENIRCYVYSEYGKPIIDIIEKAISAYEEGRSSADFTYNQMNYIYVLFFGLDASRDLIFGERLGLDSIDSIAEHLLADAIIEDFGEFRDIAYKLEVSGGYVTNEEDYQTICRYGRVDYKINEIMESSASKFQKLEGSEIEEIEITHKKGRLFHFPKYMRAIFLGIHAYSDQLPFKVLLEFFDEEDDNIGKKANKEQYKQRTLWARKWVLPVNSIDEELWKSYCNVNTYIDHKRRIELCYAKMDKMSDMNRVYACLKGIYIFCIGTLAKVFSERNKSYEEPARDAFERMFSLYLFRVETDLIYEKVKAVGELLEQSGKFEEEKDEGKERLEIAKYVVKTFSPDVLYDLYCSPGIHHRICLSEYISRIDIRPEDLASQYLANKERDDLESSRASRLRREIAGINEKYSHVEEKCTKEYFCAKEKRAGESEKVDIRSINESCRESDKIGGYREYYDGIKEEITKERGVKNVFNRSSAKRIAEKLLNEEFQESPAYKLIQFWVIFSSYFPRTSSWVTLKNG